MIRDDDDEDMSMTAVNADDLPDDLRKKMESFVRSKMRERHGGRRTPQPIAEAVIETLRESERNYNGPMRFKVGDIVAPLPMRAYNAPGWPAIVIEIPDNPVRTFDDREGCGSARFGRKLDMRVVQYDGTHFVGYWVESYDYELFNGKLPD